MFAAYFWYVGDAFPSGTSCWFGAGEFPVEWPGGGVGTGVAEQGGGPVEVRGAVVHDPGYNVITGLGSRGPAFFRSFGSRPK
jgi:hypothetical protein